MTMVRLGTELPHECREISDAAFRLVIEAWCWSVSRQLDDIVPKRDIRRFAETSSDLRDITGELVDAGMWLDLGDAYDIGHRFRWQWTRAQVDKHRTREREKKRRQRDAKRTENSEELATP